MLYILCWNFCSYIWGIHFYFVSQSCPRVRHANEVKVGWRSEFVLKEARANLCPLWDDISCSVTKSPCGPHWRKLNYMHGCFVTYSCTSHNCLVFFTILSCFCISSESAFVFYVRNWARWLSSCLKNRLLYFVYWKNLSFRLAWAKSMYVSML